MTRLRFVLVAAALAFVTSHPGFSAQVFNTGVATGGGLETAGAQDVHYPLLFPSTCCFSGIENYVATAPQIAFGSYSGAAAWMANTATAQWVTSGSPHSGAYFEISTTFTLTPGDMLAGGLQITGLLALSADYDFISLNGVASTGNSFTTDFGAALHAFTINDGFVAGTNTLKFSQQWTDGYQITFGNARVGFMVDQLQIAGGEGGGAVPEPATYTMLSLGLAGLAYRRFRSV